MFGRPVSTIPIMAVAFAAWGAYVRWITLAPNFMTDLIWRFWAETVIIIF